MRVQDAQLLEHDVDRQRGHHRWQDALRDDPEENVAVAEARGRHARQRTHQQQEHGKPRRDRETPVEPGSGHQGDHRSDHQQKQQNRDETGLKMQSRQCIGRGRPARTIASTVEIDATITEFR